MKDFTDPYTMAKILSRRRIGASTIYQMVKEKFGFSPSRNEILYMKGTHQLNRSKIRAEANRSDCKQEYLTEADYRQQMADSCEMLLRALWREHGTILQHLREKGYNVVIPK